MREISDLHIHMSDLNFDKAEFLLDVTAEIGVKRVALQSLTYRSIAYNLWLLYWKEKFKKLDLSVFGMIHNQDFYSAIPYEEQVKTLLEIGCDGIKLMNAPGSRKNIGYGINDQRYEKMFTYLEDNGVPIVVHVADPEEFWIPRELTASEAERGWGYFNGGYLSKEEIYRETFEMLDRHPRLKVTFAHFFFLSNCYDEAVRVMQTYPNVSFDLTPGWEMYVGFSKDIERWREFFIRYADRIYFGTDSNNTKSFISEINMHVRWALERGDEFVMPFYPYVRVKGLSLPEDVIDKICSKNYDKLVGKTKPVDTEAVKKYARRIIEDTNGMDDDKFKDARKCLEAIIEKI